MDRYWIRENNGPWQEVDMAAFVVAERRAGLHNTMGRPDLPGTSGFSHSYHPGQADEWSIEGTMIDPTQGHIRRNLNQLDGTTASAVKLLTQAGIPLTDEDIEALGGMPDERGLEGTTDR